MPCPHGKKTIDCTLCQEILAEEEREEDWGDSQFTPTPQEPIERAFADIDQTRLDQEWREQPGLFLRHRDALAHANKAIVAAKGRLKYTEAELRLAIRRDPQNYGLSGKPTVDTVEDAMTLQPAYQKALADYGQAMFEAELLDGAVEALRQRKNALENLVQLEGQAYHSEPKVRNHTPYQPAMNEDEKRSVRRQGMSR